MASNRTRGLAVFLLAASSVGCGPGAQVTCKEQGEEDVVCSVKSLGAPDKTYDVCWALEVTCGKGHRTAKPCQKVGGGKEVTTVIAGNRLSGDQCVDDKVTAIDASRITSTKM
jgi:hypothetical protein